MGISNLSYETLTEIDYHQIIDELSKPDITQQEVLIIAKLLKNKTAQELKPTYYYAYLHDPYTDTTTLLERTAYSIKLLITYHASGGHVWNQSIDEYIKNNKCSSVKHFYTTFYYTKYDKKPDPDNNHVIIYDALVHEWHFF